MKTTLLSLLFGLLVASATHAADTVPVTVDNFARAESDLYFGNAVKDAGGTGKFFHHRELMSIERQTVIRPNRDTLYSPAVFDLDAGPVTITLPDAGQRFMSMMIINEDHYVPMVVYGKGSYTIDKGKIGTRYAIAGVRTLVDPTNPDDFKQVHSLQDAITVEQPGGPGKFETPSWDPTSQKKIRQALLVLNDFTGGFQHAFGAKDQVDPVRHLIATAAGWGGNPDKDATYYSITPAQNDGTTVYRLSVKDVPVDSTLR